MSIDIDHICKRYGYERSEIAKLLFPDLKYPNMALYRVRSGVSELTATQVRLLADTLNVSMEELYEPAETWNARKAGKYIHFRKGDTIASLDTESWVTTIKSPGKNNREIYVHRSSIPLRKYITLIDNV